MLSAFLNPGNKNIYFSHDLFEKQAETSYATFVSFAIKCGDDDIKLHIDSPDDLLELSTTAFQAAQELQAKLDAERQADVVMYADGTVIPLEVIA